LCIIFDENDFSCIIALFIYIAIDYYGLHYQIDFEQRLPGITFPHDGDGFHNNRNDTRIMKGTFA